MPVTELVAGLVQLRRQLLLRRRVDGAAVLVEEQVDQRVDGVRSVGGGEDVASPKRLNLVEEAVEEVGGVGAGGETAGGTADAVLVVVAGCPGVAALDDRATLDRRHLDRSHGQSALRGAR
jgi:hypothetical protein